LHSVLPHQHHDDLNDSEHKEAHAEADDLIDYLKLVFHTDLGDGHMENFDQGKGYDLDLDTSFDSNPDIAAVACVQPFLNNISNSIHFQNTIPHDVPILRQYFLSNTNFRGPPAIV